MIAGAAPWLQACGGDSPIADFAGTPGPAVSPGQTPIPNVKPTVITTTEKLNSFADITSYNNFYEFGTGKNDPQRVRRLADDKSVEGEDRRSLRQAG